MKQSAIVIWSLLLAWRRRRRRIWRLCDSDTLSGSVRRARRCPKSVFVARDANVLLRRNGEVAPYGRGYLVVGP